MEVVMATVTTNKKLQKAGVDEHATVLIWASGVRFFRMLASSFPYRLAVA